MLSRFQRINRNDTLVSLALARAGGGGTSIFGTVTPVWYLDPVNGNNNAPGTSPSTAIKTTGELEKRVGLSWIGANTDVDVFLLNDFPSGSPAWNIVAAPKPPHRIWIHGKQKIVVTGSVTIVSGMNAGANTALVVNSAGTPWSSNIGKFYNVTSGAFAGLAGPIRADLGGGHARLGAIGATAPSTDDVEPIGSPGASTFSITTPTVVPPIIANVDGVYTGQDTNQGQLVITDCDLSTLMTADSFSVFSGSGFVQFGTCLIGPSVIGSSFSSAVACNYLPSNTAQIFIQGNHSAAGGAAFQSPDGFDVYGVQINSGAHWTSDDFGIEGFVFLAIAEGGSAGFLTIDVFNSDEGIFCAPGSNVVFEIGGHILWGTGNTGSTLALLSGSTATVSSDYQLVATNDTADWTVDGRATSTTLRSDTGAPITAANTWQPAGGNFAKAYGSGGFNGSVTDVVSGARLLKSASI